MLPYELPCCTGVHRDEHVHIGCQEPHHKRRSHVWRSPGAVGIDHWFEAFSVPSDCGERPRLTSSCPAKHRLPHVSVYISYSTSMSLHRTALLASHLVTKRTFSSSYRMAAKQEWMVILHDKPGMLSKRMEVRKSVSPIHHSTHALRSPSSTS